MIATRLPRLAALTACALATLVAPTYAQGPAAVFGAGFHKEEKSGDAVFRWARQNAAFTVTATAAGRHTIELGLCSAFHREPIRVELLQADGRPAASFTVTASEPTRLQPCRAVVDLTVGSNGFSLRAEASEVRFSAEDQRDVALGVGTTIRVVPEPPASR